MASPCDFLVFRLWGPMVSWGSIAVGEQRHSWTRPSRSAVLGMVAAALGHPRAEVEAHRMLEACLGFAVRPDAAGRPLRDYHTAQSPQSEAKRRWRSRHDEIHGAKKLNTILSERTYYTEMNAVVALWRRASGAAAEAPSLAAIAEHLRRPVFTLYLGRKASPLGVPVAPLLVTDTDLRTALARFDAHEAARLHDARRTMLPFAILPQVSRAENAGPQAVWLDPKDLDVAAAPIKQHTSRRDGIRDRGTWTFDDRAEVRIEFAEAAP